MNYKITNDTIISNMITNRHANIEEKSRSIRERFTTKYTRVKDFYNSYVKNWNDCDLSRDIWTNKYYSCAWQAEFDKSKSKLNTLM